MSAEKSNFFIISTVLILLGVVATFGPQKHIGPYCEECCPIAKPIKRALRLNGWKKVGCEMTVSRKNYYICIVLSRVRRDAQANRRWLRGRNYLIATPNEVRADCADGLVDEALRLSCCVATYVLR